MASNSTHEFPSLIGGTPYPIDFVPSILFSVLHGILVPIFAWRLARSQTRHFVLVGVCVFTIERTVLYALRANAAHHVGPRISETLETYMQTTLSGSFISIGMGVVQLTRCLLKEKSKKLDSTSSSETSLPTDDGLTVEGPPNLEDHPRTRAWIRYLALVSTLLLWVAMSVSIVAGVDYQGALSGEGGNLVRLLWYVVDPSFTIGATCQPTFRPYRYISVAFGLALLVGLAVGAIWACFLLPRVRRSSIAWIVLAYALCSMVAIYRLVVMRYSTTSLLSTAPGSLNSPQAKAAFYVFHAAPEYLAAAFLLSLDTRRIFDTGLWGDRRFRDPKPKV
ncbi:hypothetical protein C8T65DRAFT_576791 [Cerioporus squamosus]|nr:hypothetical protein C8T65DRAFT_576791 [Cerioporus squamosus]